MELMCVCPAEDALQAFIDYLVDPLLPIKPSSCEPSISLQLSVGKQAHAVVLLYNYYHRKQNPVLQFLGFESFCKLAVVLKPALVAHLRFSQRSGDNEVIDLEKLSISEKMIMNACKISEALDAAKSVPTIEGWPVSKVAVLLVDSQTINCFIKYDCITQGVQSLLESNLDSSNSTIVQAPTTGTAGYKRKRNSKISSRDGSSADEVVLKQLAFSAIKKEIDVIDADLSVLESHVVYSHSKEKEATRFYIIRCMVSTGNGRMQFPIKEAIESLQGPLLRKMSHNWVASPVVEYFHLLPYAKMISDWFSRVVSSAGLQDNRIRLVSETTDDAERKQTSCKIQHNEKRDRSHLINGSVGIAVKETSSFSNVLPESSSLQCASDMPIQTERGQSSGVHLAIDDKDRCLLKAAEIENLENPITLCPDGDSNCRSSLEAKIKVVNARDAPNKVSVDYNRKDNHISVANCSKNREVPSNEIAATEKGFCNALSANEHEPFTSDYSVITYDTIPEELKELALTINSKSKELSQAATKVLLRKKDKLSMQMRSLEDEMALCDQKIQTILRGGKDEWAVKIESIIEGCNYFCMSCNGQEKNIFPSNDQPLLRKLNKKSSEIQDPCQELDVLCRANNWMLPTYHAATSESGIQARLTLKESDFEFLTSGDMEQSPCEARASAAAKLLAIFRKIASLPQ